MYNHREELYSYCKYMGCGIYIEHVDNKYYGYGYANGACLYEASGYCPVKVEQNIKNQIAEDLVYD
jgi:hypothetical protein